MIEGLERFLGELRRHEISASPAEWLDAVRAVELVGLADKERFRCALRSSLAKRASQRAVFDRVFDAFFVSPARRTTGSGSGEAVTHRHQGREAEPKGSRLQRAESRAREPLTDRSEGPRILENWLRQARLGDPTRRSRLRNVILAADRSATGDEARRPAARPDELSEDPLRRSLARPMTTEAEREMAEQVPRLIERIRLGSGRRLRRAPRGRLYPRSVFRENLSRGGVPFVLPRRRIKPRRNRIVLLVDVSWSTARAAGLFLCIAGEFLRRAGSVRVVLFVDRAVDGTRTVGQWLADGAARPHPPRLPRKPREKRSLPGSGLLRGELDFASLLRGVPRLNLDAPSDYGRAFHDLLRSTSRPVGRDTILLVLGDGRTNRFDAQAWAFEEIVERCGAALWIVPEPLERWGTGDSALAEYLPLVDVAVEAQDLVGLARGVAELLRRI